MKMRSIARRADLVLLARHREHHVQEVLGIFEIVARIDEGLADRVLVGHRGDGWHLRDQTIRRDHALVRIGNIKAVVIEGRQRADHAAHHRHRVRVAAEAGEEPVDLLMQHRVQRDVALELLLLCGIRQLALEQEVADFHEIGILGEVLNRVAAMHQHAFVAVDIGELGFAACGRGEAGVVSEMACLAVELSDVDDLGPDGSAHQRQIEALAGTVVDQRNELVALGLGGGGTLVIHGFVPCATDGGMLLRMLTR
jgi:hypothetical protein